MKFLLAGTLWAQDSFSLEEVADLFPSRGLENRIEFWKKIFHRYGEREVLLHDRDDLRLVYQVVRFNRGITDDDAEASRQREQLKKKMEELKERLGEIARWGPDSPHLSKEQWEIVALLRRCGYSVEPHLLERLRENIRYQRGIREKFEASLIRSGMYLEYIQKIFREHGLPEELSYLPHIESSFDYSAYSKAGAAGIWQFTRGTGRLFLTIDRYVDERLDPIQASHGAARLLKENYIALGTWPLAITAYNHGKYGMLRARREHGSDIVEIIENYSSRSFGFAGKNFYPEFLASLEVAKNHRKYFPNIEIAQPLEFDEIRLDRAYSVRHLAEVPRLSLGVLTAYNPHLRTYFRNLEQTLPPGLQLRLPRGLTSSTLTALQEAPLPPAPVLRAEDGSLRYRVQPGDSLGLIASRFGTSPQALQRLNGIDNPHRIYPGQLLRLSPSDPPVQAGNGGAERISEGTWEKGRTRYQVRPGDTLAAIAGRLQTTVAHLQQENGIQNPHRIRPGQWIVVPGGNPPDRYTVKPGDSLTEIAERFGVSLDELQRVNRISDPDRIRPGQVLMLSGSGGESRRYRVSPGDNLASIASRFGVSVRELQAANGIRDADRIYPGQELVIP